MSKIATLQPSSASRRVMARPMPWPPPVTIATLPDKPFKSHSPGLRHFGRPSCGGGIFGARRPCALTALGERKTTLRKHLTGDDGFHDLDRSARDLDDPGVDIGARDRILRHIAPAAEQLQAFIDGFAMKLRGE